MKRWIVLGSIAFSAAAFAQSPVTFDVASVKRTQGAPGALPFVFIQSGRLRAPFSTARELIQAAWGVEPNQVIGGPAWVDADHFEIAANLPDGVTTTAAQVMLQRLLAERFGLVTRREQRELPVYFLDATGKLGPNLSPASIACKPLKGPIGMPAPPPPPPPPAGMAPVIPLNEPRRASTCPTAMFGGFFSMRAVSMTDFVIMLSRQVGRPVIDRTGLNSVYDIDLSFLPDTGPMMLNGTPINADAPSLSTAVREQLGLRMESGRAPVDVVVIDRINPPTEN